MKTLIFGQNGQLANEWKRLQAEHGWSAQEFRQVGSAECDFRNFGAIGRVVQEFRPELIINTAAFTAVDRAETEREAALQINAEALGVIGESAQKIDAVVIHYSTDYVFNGQKKTAYLEDDQTDPVNFYGESKRQGEKNLLATNAAALIFRVGWIYGSYGQNFLKTILRLAGERSELSIVSDQHGAPTSSRAITEATLNIIKGLDLKDKAGIYHMPASGKTTWHEFANEIIEKAKKETRLPLKVTNVRAIPTAEFKTAARRPVNSVLSGEKLRSHFGVVLPEWNQDIGRVLQDLEKSAHG